MPIELRLLVLIAIGPACAACISRPDSQKPTVSPRDAGLAATRDGGGARAQCSDDRDCGTGSRCYLSTCIIDQGICHSDEDCEQDSFCLCLLTGDGGFCSDSLCFPYYLRSQGGFDPRCVGPEVPVPPLEPPVVKCHWQQGTRAEVDSTPVVADLDRDGHPEVIFVALDSADYDNDSGSLVAISGDDCSEVWRQRSVRLSKFPPPAVGDLDGDGFPEIVAVGISEVAVFDHMGNVLLQKQVPNIEGLEPSLVDIDGTTPPEIVIGSSVFRYDPIAQRIDTLWEQPPNVTVGPDSLVADIFANGTEKLVTGDAIFDATTGRDETPPLHKPAMRAFGTHVAISDLDGNGNSEILSARTFVYAKSLEITLFAYEPVTNRFLFDPVNLLGAASVAGPITVADVDGDGVSDVVVSTDDVLHVLALKCLGQFPPNECVGGKPGFLWTRQFPPRGDSQGSGPAVFDLNGDGAIEIIYRGDCWLRIYDGATGRAEWAMPMTSPTFNDQVVIADTDGNGTANIVVSSGPNPSFCPPSNTRDETGKQWDHSTSGVFILADALDRWSPTRPMWPSQNYHVTDISDDLSVPVHESPFWRTTGTFRRNVQGTRSKQPVPSSAYDFTAASSQATMRGSCLQARICNRGTGTAGAGVTGAFYDRVREAPQATRLCTVSTKEDLEPGGCEDVACDPKMGIVVPKQVVFYANDGGDTVLAECKKKNNQANIVANCAVQ